MTNKFEKCVMVNDGMYCETHQCGATDEQCGKVDCPHCSDWLKAQVNKRVPLNEVSETIRRQVLTNIHGNLVTHIIGYDPEREKLKCEPQVMFTLQDLTVAFVVYGHAGSAL